MEYISAKTIVTKTKAPAKWFGIDYNMNIYKGAAMAVYTVTAVRIVMEWTGLTR